MGLFSKARRIGLISTRPAQWWEQTWREGFFCGNGRTGANVLGGVAEETILLSQTGVYRPGRINVVPDISAKLREIRSLLQQKKHIEAAGVLQKAFLQKNFRPQPISSVPTCELKVHSCVTAQNKNYKRFVDFETGEVSVSFEEGAANILRRLFVSRETDCIYFDITESVPMHRWKFSLQIPKAESGAGQDGFVPEAVQCKYEKGWMFFACLDNTGADYGAVVRVQANGGVLTAEEDGITVEGAKGVYCVAKLFRTQRRERAWNDLKTELSTGKDGYDKALKKHSVLHQKLFKRVSVEWTDIACDSTTEELQPAMARGEISSVLAEKLWNLGRYLLVCGTDENGGLFSSSGLWNGSYAAGTELRFDGEVQQAYRLALTGNLPELLEPLFAFCKQNEGDFKDDAMRLFGCRGIYLPSVTSGTTGRLGTSRTEDVFFTGCAALVAQIYYERFLYTGDERFLKTRALPFMKEVALFYEELLKLDATGKYQISPCCLPASSDGSEKQQTAGINSTADFALVRQLLLNLDEGSRITGLFEDERAKWEEMLKKIPPIPVENDLVQDYGYAMKKQTYCERGCLALFDASFGDGETLSAEMRNAFLQTAEKRLSESLSGQTSEVLLQLAEVFLHLNQPGRAFDVLGLLVQSCLMNNLVATKNDWRGYGLTRSDMRCPMQLQTNLAIAHLLQEAFCFYFQKTAYILSGYRTEWGSISLQGALLGNGTSVDVNYSATQSKLSVTIRGKSREPFRIVLPQGIKKVLKTSTGVLPQKEEDGTFTFDRISVSDEAPFVFLCKYVP